jgi:GT2 family glycosyltransferase
MVSSERSGHTPEVATASSVTNPSAKESSASVIYVAYGIETLDLSWIPEHAMVLVVHNDGLLAESACRPGCRHIYPDTNIGFGSGVNLALRDVSTRRVIVCNPDMALSPIHWSALIAGEQNEVVTVSLVDSDGSPKASAFPYPSPTLLILGITRAVKAAPVGTVRRKIMVRVLGDWGEARKWSVAQPPGRYPLATWWASGAVLSFDTRTLRDVLGFDPDYFLYFEDTDLCRRIARAVDSAFLVIADTPPAVHHVGGSASTPADRRRVASERWQSARRYASAEIGMRWRVAGLLLSVGAVVHRLFFGRPTTSARIS